MWQWIGKNHEQIKIVFAVLAALYAMVEYRIKIHDDKVAQALAMIEKYDEGGVSEARSRLNKFWVSDTTKNWTSQLRKESSAEARKERYHRELPERLKSENLMSDVYQVLEYYKRVAVCVKSGHCDPRAVCENVFEDVQGYRENYNGILVHWKLDLGDIGPDEITHLAQNSCAAEFKTYCNDVPGSPYCPKS